MFSATTMASSTTMPSTVMNAISEIRLIELFAQSPVVAITLNHEDMNDDDVADTIAAYEEQYGLPVTDVLKAGCDKLIERLFEVFPQLRKKTLLACPPQD